MLPPRRIHPRGSSLRRLAVAATLALSSVSLTAVSSAAAATIARGSVSGKVVSIHGDWFTVQTPGRWTGVVDAMTTTASRMTRRNYPYVYGGGHAQAGVASIGIPGPGYNGRRVGFDCSGSVAAVLAGGGLWQWGSGVPNDYWIVQQLLGEGLIAPGAGRGAVEVTLYDDPNYHIFMNIDGGFFGTSDGGGGGDPAGGPGWLYDSAWSASSRSYRRYHVVAGALTGNAGSGHRVTFQFGSSQTEASDVVPNAKLRVRYAETASGILIATAVSQ